MRMGETFLRMIWLVVEAIWYLWLIWRPHRVVWESCWIVTVINHTRAGENAGDGVYVQWCVQWGVRIRTGAGKYIDQTQKWSNISNNKDLLKLNKILTNKLTEAWMGLWNRSRPDNPVRNPLKMHKGACGGYLKMVIALPSFKEIV